MNCVLVAVDGTKGSWACITTCERMFAGRSPPPAVVLLHVMQYGGPTGADGLSSDAELAELREAIEGTPKLEALKAKAEACFAAPRAFLLEHGFRDVRKVIKSGRPAEEILNGAAECGAELIVIGNTRSLIARLMLGDVAHQVARGATVPVLLAR
jgi:nucleotide-binding universal stress UspA family protein